MRLHTSIILKIIGNYTILVQSKALTKQEVLTFVLLLGCLFFECLFLNSDQLPAAKKDMLKRAYQQTF